MGLVVGIKERMLSRVTPRFLDCLVGSHSLILPFSELRNTKERKSLRGHFIQERPMVVKAIYKLN